MPLTHRMVREILSHLGFKLVSQRGSHQKYNKNTYTIIVPAHQELKPGTAKAILAQIANSSGISLQTLLKEYSIKL